MILRSSHFVFSFLRVSLRGMSQKLINISNTPHLILWVNNLYLIRNPTIELDLNRQGVVGV